jgi:hypothetical protein
MTISRRAVPEHGIEQGPDLRMLAPQALTLKAWSALAQAVRQ